MKRLIWVVLPLMFWAEKAVCLTPPLFGEVQGIAENDVLNVRADLDPLAKKVGSLPLKARVGVDRCQQKGRSLWCKVYPLAQNNYEDYGSGSPSGWVNAHYLQQVNRGYVLVDGVGNCGYALDCDADACRVVTAVQFGGEKAMGLTIAKYARASLRGESNFGAAAEDAEGYCANGKWIEDYLSTSQE